MVPVGSVREAEELIRKLSVGAVLMTLGDRLVRVIELEQWDTATRLAADWVAIRDEHAAEAVID
jgi:2-keto-3-deoxy-6-phosphogluconate aldolase